MAFTADSSRVDAVLPQPNHSGYVGKPCAFGIHDIECPPGDRYQSLAGPDYLQNPAEQHSVQYVRIGRWLAQGVPESQWAWGMGTPASKHTTHVEQAGYASFSRAQWLGDASAVGSTYKNPNNGTVFTYTSNDAQFMADQLDGLAGDYADWCKRWGYAPRLGSMDDLARTCRGEELGIAFTHAMASRLPNTTTVHTDPGENYPLDVFITKALNIFNGGGKGNNQPSGAGGPTRPTIPAPPVIPPAPIPTGDTNDMADITPAQMDQIADKVWGHILSNRASAEDNVVQTNTRVIRIVESIEGKIEGAGQGVLTILRNLAKKAGA